MNPISDNPYFSIIVPTYNQANYLPLALNTLINQSYNKWEALIVNDGSTDDTSKIMKNFAAKDNRINLFHKKNGGCASALNKGLKNANGQWICWLSSDDLFELDKLEIHKKAIEDNPDIYFFYTHFYYLYESSGVKSEPELWPFMPEQEFALIRLFLGNYVHGNSIAIHKSVFDDVGLFKEDLKYAQDYEMWLRISAKYKSKLINRRTCVTRWHELQTTNTFPEAGLFDSARACSNFLNKNDYIKLFPFLDLDNKENAAKALQEVINIAANPNALMYSCGYRPELLERTREWLANSCSEEVRNSLQPMIIQAITNLNNAQIPLELKQDIQNLYSADARSYRYKKHNFLNEIKELATNLSSAGNNHHSKVINRYIKMVKDSIKK